MKREEILCPFCDQTLKIDSVREYTDGRKRIYWECDSCRVSIMLRDKEK